MASMTVEVRYPDGRREWKPLEVHPLALLVPGMTDTDLERLRADIEANGMNEPLVLFEGKVLDGRHRLVIAYAAKLPVEVTEFDGDEKAAKQYVWSANIARRHLSLPQLALAADRFGFIEAAKAQAAKLPARSDGSPRPGGSWPNLASAAIGHAVTPKSLSRFAAGRVAEAPETVADIDAGKIRRLDRAAHAAAVELGLEPPPPVARSAWDRLGCARGDVVAAEAAVMMGNHGDLSPEKFARRAREIQSALIRIQQRLRDTA
jgi:hypothetical protein